MDDINDYFLKYITLWKIQHFNLNPNQFYILDNSILAKPSSAIYGKCVVLDEL
jgi:hypothetical protein